MKKVFCLVFLLGAFAFAQERISSLYLFSFATVGSSNISIKADVEDEIFAIQKAISEKIPLPLRSNFVLQPKKNINPEVFHTISEIYNTIDSIDFGIFNFYGPWRSIPGKNDQFLLTDLQDSVTSNYLFNLLSFCPAKNWVCILFAPREFQFSSQLLEKVTVQSATPLPGKNFVVIQYSAEETYESAIDLYEKAWNKISFSKAGRLLPGYMSMAEFLERFDAKLRELELRPQYFQVIPTENVILSKEY